MKKMVLFALLFAAVAASAHARVDPKCNVQYRCYYQNYPGPILDGGVSIFTDCVWARPDLLRTIEKFQRPFNGNIILDNRKATFAKGLGEYFDYYLYSWATDWEFTINPYGPQCTKAEVSYSGNRIDFSNCSDGHSRVCATYW